MHDGRIPEDTEYDTSVSTDLMPSLYEGPFPFFNDGEIADVRS